MPASVKSFRENVPQKDSFPSQQATYTSLGIGPATKVICPVSKTPIMESKNCYFSDAFPEMRFPKQFWGHAFTPEEVCLVVEATANKTEPPRFTFTRGGGRGTYEAAISLGKDGFLVPTPIESESAAQGITV